MSLLDKLIKENDIYTEEGYINFLKFISKGNMDLVPLITKMEVYTNNHNYSIMNTFSVWKEYGYQVTRGMKGTKISCKKGKSIVFDISQTIPMSKNMVSAEKMIFDTEKAKFLGYVSLNYINDEVHRAEKIWKTCFGQEITEFAKASIKYILMNKLTLDNKAVQIELPEYREFASLLEPISNVIYEISKKLNENVRSGRKYTWEDYKEYYSDEEVKELEEEINDNESELQEEIPEIIEIPAENNTEKAEYSVTVKGRYFKGDIVNIDDVRYKIVSIDEKQVELMNLTVPEPFFSLMALEEFGKRLAASIKNEETAFYNEGKKEEKYTYLEPKITDDIPEEYIELALRKGSGFENGKKRIINAMRELSSKAEKAAFIKKEYGLGGMGWPIGSEYGVHGFNSFKSEKGLKIQWRNEEGENETYIPWRKVCDHIENMIKNGTYLQKGYVEDAKPEPVEDEPEAVDIEEKNIDEKELMANDDLQGITPSGKKERYNRNVLAIKALKKIESENRIATESEKTILSGYVGWGGVPDAFDSENEKWKKEYEELKELLTEQEYKDALSSVNTAFYTDRRVIDSVYTAVRKLGFTGGKILEPAMGTGRFFQYMPTDIRRSSQLYGVEIDDVSGRIAKLLNPDAVIQIDGFENVNFKQNEFDLVIGNVPFGDYEVLDRKSKFNKYKIHDYFLGKSLSLLREGGIMAVITSKGTLDKQNDRVRQLMADSAELIGAVRMPKGTFGDTAATCDLLLFAKTSDNRAYTREWMDVINDENEIPYNEYFHAYPENMIGHMVYSSMYDGKSVTECVIEDKSKIFDELKKIVEDKLDIEKIYIERDPYYEEEKEETGDIMPVPDDIAVKKYSFAIIDDIPYYRTDGSMLIKCSINERANGRIKDYVKLRDLYFDIIEAQKDGCSDDAFENLKRRLNKAYDVFADRYGYIANNKVRNKGLEYDIQDDIHFNAVVALENVKEIDADGKKQTVVEKSEIFRKRTINPYVEVKSVDTPLEGIYQSMAKYGRLNIRYIAELCSRTEKEVVDELIEKKEIFFNPELVQPGKDIYSCFETSADYLSGNVRKKRDEALKYSIRKEKSEYFKYNVEELDKVVPVKVTEKDIKLSIGTKFIKLRDYEQFISEIIQLEKYQVDRWGRRSYAIYDDISISREDGESTYFVNNKKRYSNIVENNTIYGTSRLSALEIFEMLLNKRNVEVRDREELPGGKYRYVKNEAESMKAVEKAEKIEKAFEEWLFRDNDRKIYYVDLYNNLFNSEVLKKYDGSYINIPFMNPNIELRAHQKDAIARIMAGNTLLAHPVGAGKTFVMAAACMEMKRLGHANKPMLVVPNPLIGQVAKDFMTLFPAAEILVTTERDFEKSRRQVFVSKIATGDYDAVIIGHSQYEKIGISIERQQAEIKQQISELESAIRHSKDNYSVKQMESRKKKLAVHLNELINTDKKDQMICFEDLGVDALIVDEAHMFKNLNITTKMSRISGIQTASSQKAMDMYMKVKYIRSIKGERNIVFSTGTPLSNTVCEMYNWQKYLAEGDLLEKGISNFDDWISLFGRVTTEWELAPEGNHYVPRQKISRFRNIPELKKMFNKFGDVRRKEELELDVPVLANGKYDIVESEPSELQSQIMDSLVIRAERIRGGGVNPREDNMLKLCNDARLMAIDPRLMNDGENIESESELEITDRKEDDKEQYPYRSKLDDCVDNVFRIYKETDEQKLTQVIFSNVGTPNANKFNVYDYIKDELVKKGIPEEEICFIHDAKNDNERQKLHSDMRKGIKRVIIGSTDKLGTGTNIQDRLIAEHDLDVPWRPSDVEQREGRIIRQGNMNKEVHIYRYITHKTFDAYNWGIVEGKQRFIEQIMGNDDIGVREHEDITGSESNGYSEFKAIASGDPRIKEKTDIDNEIRRLEVLKREYHNSKNSIQRRIDTEIPLQIRNFTQDIKDYEADIKTVHENTPADKKEISINIGGHMYNDKTEAGALIIKILRNQDNYFKNTRIGSYRGMKLESHIYSNVLSGGLDRKIRIIGSKTYTLDMSDAAESGVITRFDNALKKIYELKDIAEQALKKAENDIILAKEEFDKPFEYEDTLSELYLRQKELADELFSECEKEEMAHSTESVSIESASRDVQKNKSDTRRHL